jgi:flagellar M-ring protein FliF
MTLQKEVSSDVENKVREALTPYLGLQNFQVSVTAQLNTDRRQITETIYDPESRVERSVRVVKENESSNNASQSSATSVQESLPQEAQGPSGGENSSSSNDRREEITNYELSSKTINTTASASTACPSPCW